MKQQSIRCLGVLAFAVIAVACSPNDEGIGKSVKEKLSTEEAVKSAQITVGVQKKIVTLSGTVDSPAIKEKAVTVARGTAGVADVVDQITVKEQNVGPGPAVGHEMMEKGMAEGKNHPVERDRK